MKSLARLSTRPSLVSRLSSLVSRLSSLVSRPSRLPFIHVTLLGLGVSPSLHGKLATVLHIDHPLHPQPNRGRKLRPASTGPLKPRSARLYARTWPHRDSSPGSPALSPRPLPIGAQGPPRRYNATIFTRSELLHSLTPHKTCTRTLQLDQKHLVHGSHARRSIPVLTSESPVPLSAAWPLAFQAGSSAFCVP
jgi:hypothetical protein